MSDTRIRHCETCGGDGGGFSDPRSPSDPCHWIECPVCQGNGEFEIETELVGPDDQD